jgi:hypothetical protein
MEQQQRPQPILTRQFRQVVTPQEQKLRDERRRLATKRRTAHYRQKLYSQRIPETRHLAESLLAEFLRLMPDPAYRDLCLAWFKRLKASGFDVAEAQKRAKKLRKLCRPISGNA